MGSFFKQNKMYINKNIKFKYESTYIESVYVFKDGDFILFGMPEKSILFDGKTFESKLNLNASSDCCFFDLENDEFGLSVDLSHFQINKFNSNRTSFVKIQEISKEQQGSARKMMKILNGDLCISKIYVGYINFYIYRKNEAHPRYAPYGENFYKFLDDRNDLININDNEILTYKFKVVKDSIVLKIIDNKEYNEIRGNEIIFRNSEIGNRLYINATSTLKFVNNKLLAFSTKYLYIIGIDTLELETTIKMEYNIRNILIRPKGNLFLFLENREKRVSDDGIVGRNNEYYYKQYINSLNIDFKTNELLDNKEEDISKIMGNKKDIFKMYNYIGNGLITLIDETKVIIYEDCDDLNNL